MYSVHQELLTPVRAATEQHAGPIDHYYSSVVVAVGGQSLCYQEKTLPYEVEVYGMARARQRVAYRLRKGIMFEIEKHIFKIDVYGGAL